MADTHKDSIDSYYQIPDDAPPAGSQDIEVVELIDVATGLPLVDAATEDQLAGVVKDSTVLATDGVCTPIVIATDRSIVVDVTNRQQSEVDTSLLGIPRSETALVLFDTVNIYGVNPKEWQQVRDYTYREDPSEYTFDGSYGYYTRHLAAESAIQAYAFPPQKSFTYSFDDGSGKYPGGYTDGVMWAHWESKRAFRYQPGRVSGFTLGVRMSTTSDHSGEVIQWGCRNKYGDGYYFQLERGSDLYIVRTSPDLGTAKIARADWNGDKLLVGQGSTGWGLDLSRVTMFKIEFSWYGAVGAQFLAYVPVSNDEARWVRLHYFRAENLNTVPSLRSAYLRLYTSVSTTAGTTKPAFINLYGSSVYIDGGDKGTVTLGTAALESPKDIDTNSRSLLGIYVKDKINNVDNQKGIYPVSLAAYASVPARFDLVLRSSTCAGVQYGYGAGTSLSRGQSNAIAVTRTGIRTLQINSGTFPDITNELTGSTTTYRTGRRVRVTGTNIFDTHVTAINQDRTVITVDRDLPAGSYNIRLARMNAFAVQDDIISNGTTSGAILRRDDGGYWRIGLWPQASGAYDSTKTVVWGASSTSRLAYNKQGVVIGENRYPSPWYCNESTSFSIAIGASSYTITFGGTTYEGTGTNPFPIALVVEMMDGATISDVTVHQGSITTVGSGSSIAITAFDTLSDLTESSTAAGGTGYVAHKFEDALSDPLSGVLVDRQGTKVISTANRVATFFLGADETKQFDLSNVFGPDKMFITRDDNSTNTKTSLFVVATSRGGAGIASATLNWEEQ